MGEDGTYEELYDMRNKLYKKEYGISLDHNPNYAPIVRKKGINYSKEAELDKPLNTANIANGIGSNKQRIRNSAPMDIEAGFFETFDRHISESMQWCMGAELVHKMKTLLSSPTFVRKIKAQGVKVNVLKNCFLRAIGERLGDGSENNALIRFAKKAVGANVIFNLNSALKQFVSGTAALSQDMSWDLVKAAIKNLFPLTDIKIENGKVKADIDGINMPLLFSNYKWAMKNIPTFAERADRGTMGYDILEEETSGGKFSRWIDKLSSFGMKPNMIVDLLTCAYVSRTYYDHKYKQLIDMNYTPEEAHQEAVMRAAVLMNQTQQSSVGAFLSSLQRDRFSFWQTLARSGFTAYQNSNISFWRNSIVAMGKIKAMTLDNRYTNAREDMIAYRAEEYTKRGFSEKDANEKAREDYWNAFFSNCNQVIHNTIINHALWRIAGKSIGWLTAGGGVLRLLSWLWEDEDENVQTKIASKRVGNEVAKEAAKSLMYFIPYLGHPAVKAVGEVAIDAAIEGSVWETNWSPAMQPMVDLINSITKLSNVGEYEDDEKSQRKVALGLSALDATMRYGLGVSTDRLMRMGYGVAGISDGIHSEDIMNIFSSPSDITMMMVGRRREGEPESKYGKRVAETYKYIRNFSSVLSDAEIRKMYIDSQDANMFYNADFDYDQYKESVKDISHKAMRLPITSKGQQKKGYYEPTPEEFWKMAFMQGLAGGINKIESALLHPMKCNWDNDGANERRELYELADVYVQTFYRIKDAKSEEDIREILSVYVEANNKHSIPRLEAEGVKITKDILLDVDGLMQAREEVIEGKNINK